MANVLSAFASRDALIQRRVNPRPNTGVNDPRLAFEFGAEITYRINGRSGVFLVPFDAIKSIDRPAVEPQTEQLNQYNKKRVVYTGYKLRPLKIAFYDLRNSQVMNFMSFYLEHYFGDFKQQATAWNYDQTTKNFNDGGSGFGFTARYGGRQPSDNTSANIFFDRIRVHQPLNRDRTQIIEIINPKVSEFDFDEFDYSSNEPVIINVAFEFEAMLLTDVSGTDAGAEAVRRGVSNQVVNYQNPVSATRSTARPNDPGNLATPISNGGVAGLTAASWRASSSNTGGGLNLFGNFNFGNLAGIAASRAATGNFRGVGSELAFYASGNPVLTTILNSATTRNSRSTVADIGSAVMGSLQRPPGGASAALWDAARAGLGASTFGTRATQGSAAGALAQGLFASATAGGSRASSTNGLYVSPEALAMTNATQPGYAQYGFNDRYDPE